jgi:hypothetical protein
MGSMGREERFVIDGHHRIAVIARNRKNKTLPLIHADERGFLESSCISVLIRAYPRKSAVKGFPITAITRDFGDYS